MANDLVTRLTLNNKDFESNLTKSTRQIKDFKRQSEDQSKAIKAAFSGIAKAAGGIGIAFSVMEGVNKTIAGSQTLTDEFGRTMEAAKGSVNLFFNALATGSFSSFIEGLKEVQTQAKAAYNAVDDLGTFEIYKAPDLAKLNYERQQQRTILRDPNSSDTQKVNANKELLRIQEDIIKISKKEAEFNENAFKATFKQALAERGIRKEISDIELEKLSTFEEYSRIQAEVAKVDKEINELRKFDENTSLDRYNVQDRLDKISRLEANADYKFGKAYLELADDKLKSSFEYRTAAYNALSQIEALKQQDNKLIGSNNSNESGLKGNYFDFNDTSDIDDKVLQIQSTLNQRPLLLTIKPEVNDDELDDVLGDLAKQAQQRIENLKESAQSINEISGMFSNLGQIMSQNGNEWGTYVSNVMSSIGELISQFVALAIAKEATSPLGIIKSITAGIALIGTLTNIPKFESGGIVGGSSFYGDNVLARVNSGEMILNKKQQSNLFSMLNNGSSGLGSGNVQFEIKGDKLVGVLNNYNNKRGKTL